MSRGTGVHYGEHRRRWHLSKSAGAIAGDAGDLLREACEIEGAGAGDAQGSAGRKRIGDAVGQGSGGDGGPAAVGVGRSGESQRAGVSLDQAAGAAVVGEDATVGQRIGAGHVDGATAGAGNGPQGDAAVAAQCRRRRRLA